jgi:ABC-type uncharacterized transport system ATPase subunit
MNAAIEVEALHKSFRVKERAPGFGRALRGLFGSRVRQVSAVEQLSFRVGLRRYESGNRFGVRA